MISLGDTQRSTPPDTLTATLSFFSPPKDQSRPFYRTTSDPAYGLRSNFTNEHHEVEVENIRDSDPGTYTLDTAGFQFFKRAAKHTSFTDGAQIAAEYYPESAALIKEFTGASRVVIFDHSEHARLFSPCPSPRLNQCCFRDSFAAIPT